jgi:hypothetical protein
MKLEKLAASCTRADKLSIQKHINALTSRLLSLLLADQQQLNPAGSNTRTYENKQCAEGNQIPIS